VLQERYEILSVQGVGGMGAVYRARDLRFSAVEKIIAVKEMNNSAPDPRLRQIGIQNFEREANILASLSHSAIPKIFDYFSEGNRSYLILEFVEGPTVEDLLEERRQPFPQEEAINWALQVCDVLAYLHSQKPPVVFRDVKPGNLILRHDGRIMVIDFGIAKVFEHGQRGTMIGTEGYSPPEQYRGVAEPRGDLYALGATLHHLLTGRDPRLEPPFTFHERPIRLFNPNVLPEIESAVSKSLAYDIEDRWSTAAEMGMALRSALPQTGEEAPGPAAPGLSPRQDVQVRWKFKCEDEVRSSSRIADGVLYVGSYDHNLYALSVADGSFKWKYPTEGGIASTPCIYGDAILVGSEDGALHAVSRRTERLLWTCPTNGPIRSSARIELDHAFIGSDDGCLYAINAMSGRVVWQFQSAGPIRSTPLLVREMVFVGSDDGYVYGLDMRTGNVKWKYATHRRVTSSPAVAENLVFIGSADGHLYGLNIRSGWPVWRYRTKGFVLSSPAIEDDTVYVGSADGHLYAIEANTGRQRWAYDAESAITSSPAVHEGIVYIGANDGTVYAIDAREGHRIWQYVTGGPVPSSPLVFDGTVYIGSTDKHVYALRVR
jgi:outer membrane protein assembly factor BamB/tRNA A-37 threonylcarbamoyl transferase component Bud32